LVSPNRYDQSFGVIRPPGNSIHTNIRQILHYPEQTGLRATEFLRDKIRRKKGAVACATVAVILLQVTPVGNISACDITNYIF